MSGDDSLTIKLLSGLTISQIGMALKILSELAYTCESPEEFRSAIALFKKMEAS